MGLLSILVHLVLLTVPKYILILYLLFPQKTVNHQDKLFHKAHNEECSMHLKRNPKLTPKKQINDTFTNTVKETMA